MCEHKQVEDVKDSQAVETNAISEPILLPDKGIWHPIAPRVFEDEAEYQQWYNTVHAPSLGIDPKTAPTVGVILQKSHINTKDECHYTSLIAELESNGARVVCIYSGGLDFSGPIEEYFYNKMKMSTVDTVINLTGFSLVGGPAAQDHDKAVEVLKKLDKPYLCAVPLVFQSFEEWKSSELGLHPIQVCNYMHTYQPSFRCPFRADSSSLPSCLLPSIGRSSSLSP